MPVVTAGHAGAVGVCFLMAACAVQAGDTFTLRPTHYVCDVTMSIVTLLWIVGGGVTAGHAGAGGVCFLMAACAVQAGDTFTLRPTHKLPSGNKRRQHRR